ncbi:hypothetical protein BX659_14112 [Orenia metallireducens]|jgi:hypothetical protein|uniref:Uncharacterized protein n=1 Tax=Orenia metallireducens TaxID=1413210 RepID=A0A285IEP5_9FIRM|nr:hypothetical protein [Orenia metallireducens]PRX18821.1 hypothetical protein BX659_14112 [Orenia metallireducens]SNY46444.1 hypothetical protein SAMN06265827_14212 [Orenia metallireducens]
MEGNYGNRNEENFQIKADAEISPGHLMIKFNDPQFSEQDLRFFGVNKEGAPVSGAGVQAEQINNHYTDETTALFNISDLVQTGQFSDETVEGVITASGHEIGRHKIETPPSIYVG